MIADNRLAEKAGWDEELLAAEFQFLADIHLDFDIELTGFDAGEIDVLLETGEEPSEEEPVELPDPDQPSVSRRGDLWQIGPHRILCGNALEEADWEKFSSDGSIHYICMDWRHLVEVQTAGEGIYSEIKNLYVWIKTNAGSGRYYRSQHEMVFVFKAGQGAHINNFGLGETGRHRSNVWTYAGANAFRPDRADDLAGHFLEAGGWEHLCLPTIAETSEVIQLNDQLLIDRKAGEALHPEREPIAQLELQKKIMGSAFFSAQYQQAPVPAEGNLVQRSWIQRYKLLPDKGFGCQIVQSWDTASKEGPLNGWSVCVTALIRGRRVYVIDVFWAQLTFPALRRKVRGTREQNPARGAFDRRCIKWRAAYSAIACRCAARCAAPDCAQTRRR